ncbi:GNAT family N-acetyltransferase [Knoellia sinensis]|uniref:GNAT family N-acetyltransferase n=1 Tax=Knoellia sinensis TaxID=136100 RepID=UPI001FE1815D|nr:GNAT family N-acetyltransferase [Knoellia sinensis]
MSVTIRSRRPYDLPVLAELLGAQQSTSGYPHFWPLDFPVEDFIARPGELGAWVAEVDGELAGHVAVTDVAVGWGAPLWSEILGRPGEGFGEVSILFVGPGHGAAGIGGALLGRAIDEIRALGRDPVLEVVGEETHAGLYYRKRGWRVIGHRRPAWLPDGAPDVAFMVLDQVLATK